VAGTRNCSECGAELADNVQFCSSCGTGAESKSVDSEASAPPVAATAPPAVVPEAGAPPVAATAPPAVVPEATTAPEPSSPAGSAPVEPTTASEPLSPPGPVPPVAPSRPLGGRPAPASKQRMMAMVGGGVAVAIVIGIVVVMTSDGGKKKRSRRAPSTPVEETRGATVVPEAAVAAVEQRTAPVPVEEQMLTVDGVSDLSLRYVPRHLRARAIKLNGRAIKEHGKENYDEAIDYYTSALELWPGYLLARYNLACAFALNGDKERSMGLLKQLKIEGCVKCLERVQRARSDTDFQALWSDGDFQTLTGGIHMMLPDYEALTKKLVRELGKGYFGLLVGAANRGVSIDINGSDITDKDQLVRYKINLMKDFARDLDDSVNWRNYKPEFHPGNLYGYRLKCKADCCDIYIPRNERDSSLGEGVIGTLSKVCYWPTSETEAYPRLLKYSH